ncbi:hypothetical protein IQ06DRAFT_340850 [Phaeosphaeriaceae sp. SRC1lsM3a]|nr:hypothetical protein IQ06DRAFT_340850 [Stagonospora sp. SRC1lsM3a]
MTTTTMVTFIAFIKRKSDKSRARASSCSDISDIATAASRTHTSFVHTNLRDLCSRCVAQMRADGNVHTDLVSWNFCLQQSATTSDTAINPRLSSVSHYTANSLFTFLGATSRAAIVYNHQVNSYCDACLHRCPREAGMRALQSNGGRSQGMVRTLLSKDADSFRHLCYAR